jgi:phosphatidylserine synthase
VEHVVTRISLDPVAGFSPGQRRRISDGYRQLVEAQKPASRSAPAYSRFVNRRIGRVLAAVCWALGLSPNVVTAISAALTFSAILALALYPPSWQLGVAVSAALVLGYAFDSADGQVARLTGESSAAGEWLDHVVDATKAAALPLALAVGLYRSELVPEWWLLVPLAASVVGGVLFFAMILTEQLRRQHGSALHAPPEQQGRSLSRSLLVLPMDYGVLCLSFALLGWLPAFVVVYTAIVVATAGFLALAAGRWFSELRSFAPTVRVGS